MAEKGYTILILTDISARARQLRISQRTLGGALVGATFALLAMSYLFYHYMTFQAKQGEIEQLRQTVEAQRGVATRLQTMAEEVTRLRAFDHQIRRLAGMEEAESAMAMGGGTVEFNKALAKGEQVEREKLVDQLYQDLQRLEREVALRAESMEAVTGYLTKQKDRLAATPSIWPTRGYVSSRFGPRISPFTGRRQRHTGIDVAAARGTPILATADGIVTFSGRLAGYGRAIVITHGFGFKSFYGHNQKNKVRKGHRVKRGQVIGTVGNSGYSTGSHVHYEVIVKGTAINPLKYIIDKGRRAHVLQSK